MAAPDRFVQWLATYEFLDRNKKLPAGLRLQYHSRSDEHSKALGEFILEDLLNTCPVFRDQASRGEVAYGINYAFRWPNGKAKTLDLVIGIPTARHPRPPVVEFVGCAIEIKAGLLLTRSAACSLRARKRP